MCLEGHHATFVFCVQSVYEWHTMPLMCMMDRRPPQMHTDLGCTKAVFAQANAAAGSPTCWRLAYSVQCVTGHCNTPQRCQDVPGQLCSCLPAELAESCIAYTNLENSQIPGGDLSLKSWLPRRTRKTELSKDLRWWINKALGSQ